ncbi:hypothetical protein ACFSGX_01615 [Sphingomonas arantia]|uniref:Uncharacterized protein n=1 Tax=Sphingomonas arantia TaxID=1460676 RepID=A0ABW4TW63_9SPHN
MRIEITAGTDLDDSTRLVERLRAAGVRANLQLARVPRRFGRYFRAIVGTRLGRVEITPLRTEQGAAVPDNGDITPWTLEEANAALRLAVERHNEEVMAALPKEEGGRVPDDLAQTLEVMADG